MQNSNEVNILVVFFLFALFTGLFWGLVFSLVAGFTYLSIIVTAGITIFIFSALLFLVPAHFSNY